VFVAVFFLIDFELIAVVLLGGVVVDDVGVEVHAFIALVLVLDVLVAEDVQEV
jgi:hypothetical protein